jgi:hypothetical protein
MPEEYASSWAEARGPLTNATIPVARMRLRNLKGIACMVNVLI